VQPVKSVGDVVAQNETVITLHETQLVVTISGKCPSVIVIPVALENGQIVSVFIEQGGPVSFYACLIKQGIMQESSADWMVHDRWGYAIVGKPDQRNPVSGISDCVPLRA